VLRTALKPRWLALFVVVLAAAALMARLGQWQWDRAHDNAESNVERTLARSPVPIGDVLRARQTFTGAAADRAVVAEGSYDAARQVLVADRRLGDESGWWVLTPLVLDDGSAVGVVRGWVATSDDPAVVVGAVPAGRVALTGYLRPAEPPADRAPGRTSGLPDGEVDRVDLTQLIERWPWPLLTGYVVLTGYRAIVEPRALGIAMQALVFVTLARHARQQVKSFRQHALSLPEAIAVYHVAGQHDFLVHVGVRDANHLRDLAMDAFTSRTEVARIETHLIFEHVPKPALPVLVDIEPPPRARRGRGRLGPTA